MEQDVIYEVRNFMQNDNIIQEIKPKAKKSKVKPDYYVHVGLLTQNGQATMKVKLPDVTNLEQAFEYIKDEAPIVAMAQAQLDEQMKAARSQIVVPGGVPGPGKPLEGGGGNGQVQQ